MYLNNLGTGLRARFGRTGQLQDLEEAIGVYRRAVALTPEGSPDLPMYLNNLGTGLRARFGRTGQLQDLEEAIGVYRRAVALTPDDHPDRPRFLLSLGLGLVEHYLRTDEAAVLNAALDAYRQATAHALARTPYLLQRIVTGVRDAAGRLLRNGKIAEAQRLVSMLQALLPPAAGDGQEAETAVVSPAAVLREAQATYLATPELTTTERQSLDLLRQVLAIVSSVASALQERSQEAGYATALQALETARHLDRRTGEAFELARWVREVSGFEFVELEDADAWPPRVAYLLHLAARYERSGHWETAIATYRQARELLGAATTGQERARATEVNFRLALCLKQAGAWSEALKLQQENATAYKELGNPQGKANAYMEIGHIYQMMNLFDPALLYYAEAYYLYCQAAAGAGNDDERRSAQYGMANAKESLGTLEFQLNLLPQAIPDLQEAQQLYRELDRPDKADAVGRTLQDARTKQGDHHAPATHVTQEAALRHLGTA